MTYLDIAKRLADNCDDDAVLVEVLKDFRSLGDEDKELVVEVLLGNLSTARMTAGYGPKAVGAKWLKEQPFYAKSRVVKERDGLKEIPNVSKGVKKLLDLSEPKFFEKQHEYSFPPYITQKPIKNTAKQTSKGFKAVSNRPTKNIEPPLIRKKKYLTIKNPFYCSLKDLAEQTDKKFCLDENVSANSYQSDLDNVINSKTLCNIGTSDKTLLEKAIENSYILITKDKGMVFRSLQKSYPVVYVEHRRSLIYIDCVRIKFEKNRDSGN